MVPPAPCPKAGQPGAEPLQGWGMQLPDTTKMDLQSFPGHILA